MLRDNDLKALSDAHGVELTEELCRLANDLYALGEKTGMAEIMNGIRSALTCMDMGIGPDEEWAMAVSEMRRPPMVMPVWFAITHDGKALSGPCHESWQAIKEAENKTNKTWEVLVGEGCTSINTPVKLPSMFMLARMRGKAAKENG